jgi:hypothetical protein
MTYDRSRRKRVNCTALKVAAPTLKTISAPQACANPMRWQDRQARYLFRRQHAAQNTKQISDTGYSIDGPGMAKTQMLKASAYFYARRLVRNELSDDLNFCVGARLASRARTFPTIIESKPPPVACRDVDPRDKPTAVRFNLCCETATTVPLSPRGEDVRPRLTAAGASQDDVHPSQMRP